MKQRSSVNLLEGPILKNLIIFAIPLLISYAFQQMYNTIDTAIVGNALGTQALAAVGSVNAVYDLLIGFAFGIGGGTVACHRKQPGASCLFDFFIDLKYCLGSVFDHPVWHGSGGSRGGDGDSPGIIYGAVFDSHLTGDEDSRSRVKTFCGG